MNKRGLSMVVTTLIIILLVLVAVGIVWVVVRNVIQRGVESAEISAKCLDIDVKASAVVNIGETNYSVTLKRTASGDEIAGVKLVFFNVTDSTSSVIDVSGNIAPLGTVTKNVDGEIINANKIEVTAYFEDASGNEKPCSTASFNIGAGAVDEGTNGGNGDNGNGGGCTDTCESEGRECNTWTICDVETDCGNCTTLYGEGYVCNETGICILLVPINTGTVDSVWPPGAVKYFDSDDLPKDSGISWDYMGRYVKFIDTEICLLITWAEYLDEPGYNKSYVRLVNVADITSGNEYEIWESETCGA